MSSATNSRSTTPETTQEGNIPQTYMTRGTSSQDHVSPLTFIDLGNTEQVDFLNYEDPIRPIPFTTPPAVKNIDEQFAWIKFTRDNNKPHPYGTSSTESGPLSLSKVADLYVERYGGTATQQAISKRMNNENNLRKFYKKIPKYPRNINYQNKPPSKRKAESEEQEGTNQRRRTNNHQSIAVPIGKSSAIDLTPSQHRHEEMTEEEDKNTMNKGNSFGTFPAGWSRDGVYRPPKHIVESQYLDLNYTHLRSVGTIKDPGDEDSQMSDPSEDSEDSDEFDDDDQSKDNEDPEGSGDYEDSDDSDDSDDDSDDSDHSVEKSLSSATVSLRNNPRRRIDGSEVRENVVEQHVNGKFVFILKRSDAAE